MFFVLVKVVTHNQSKKQAESMFSMVKVKVQFWSPSNLGESGEKSFSVPRSARGKEFELGGSRPK